MAINLPVWEEIPMNVTVTGYEENYDQLGLGRNLACFVIVDFIAPSYTLYLFYFVLGTVCHGRFRCSHYWNHQ